MAKRIIKRKKKVLSPHEIEKRNHTNEIRNIFKKSGFDRVIGVSDKEFSFKDRKGDFDDFYIFENIIVLAEYTVSLSKNISDHLLKKKIIFDKVLENQEDFILFLDETFPSFKEKRGEIHHPSSYKIIITYCSKNVVSIDHKNLVTGIIYFDYPIVKYFKSITNTIKLSSKFELFEFFKLKYEDISSGSNAVTKKEIKGTVLPEAYSNFEKGFKVVSFYIDASTLLEKSYVLRKDGWYDEAGVYQRMIEAKKINAIRNYLCKEKRVFINNIIVTLPQETVLLDKDNQPVDASKLNKIEPVSIQIPDKYCVIGIIDGQHRIFAYHEDVLNENEKIIRNLRDKQNLLASGIIYPKTMSENDRIKFEAKLFLEINSTQTNAKSELKQAIGTILKPFNSESIARITINRLNTNGALLDVFAQYFFDTDKVKTTSIVSYALKPIVKLSGTDSFYSLWDHPRKKELEKSIDIDLLNEYKDFCIKELNEFLIPVKKISSSVNIWTTDKSVDNRVLTTAGINGFIILLRKLILNGKTGNQEYYLKKLEPIKKFDFKDFKSSQYNKLAEELYKLCFA